MSTVPALRPVGDEPGDEVKRVEPHQADGYVSDLWRDHHADLVAYVRRLSGGMAPAEDCAAETFEKVYRHIRRHGAEAHVTPRAWLRHIARNVVRDHFRRACVRRELLVGEWPVATLVSGGSGHGVLTLTDIASASSSADPLEVVLRKERMTEARDRLAQLTDSQAEVVVRDHLVGDTTGETAAAMGRSEQAIRSLRHKAARHLTIVAQQRDPDHDPTPSPRSTT